MRQAPLRWLAVLLPPLLGGCTVTIPPPVEVRGPAPVVILPPRDAPAPAPVP